MKTTGMYFDLICYYYHTNTYYYYYYIIRTAARFSKLPLPLVWKPFFLVYSKLPFFFRRKDFLKILFSFIANNVCKTWKYSNFQIKFLCVSSLTGFSKEEKKLRISTVYHKLLSLRLLSKIAVICCNLP